jgi:peroxiredoxin
MNRIKSVFIGLYPVVLMGLTGLAGYQIWSGAQPLAWSGVLLTTVPFLLFLSRVMVLKNLARTEPNFVAFNVTALVGTVVAGYATLDSREAELLPLTMAGVGALTFLAYSVWYSRLGRTVSGTLVVGGPFPDVELQRADGSVFQSASLRGAPALLMFYRGNWCPLCMAQVKEIAARYREISQSGARVALVSPQPHENTIELAKRFDVPFEFLTDRGNRVARRLNIEMKHGLPMGMGLLGYDDDTVFPTVVVLDREGVIRWVDQTDNYRVRPEPETFLPIIKELAVAGR